ncbi:MAG: ABC transporter permease subunit [Armatimonadetes bacterium]|nr:ABC transporter permease subunit [Armatimonadota bacterium]
MRATFREVFADNPVLAETWRPFARARRGKNWKANSIVTGLLVAAVYGALLAGGMQIVDYLEAGVFLILLVVLTPLFVATVLYPSLAAEREKKTMDLLLVAPVTAPQIVTAKLARALWPLVGLEITLLVPALVFGLVRISRGLAPGNPDANFFGGMAVIFVLSLVVAWFVAAMALFLSSVNRTTSGALTAVIGGLFVVYGVLPVFAAALSPLSRNLSEFIIAYHPLDAATRMLWPRAGDATLPAGAGVITCLVVHAVGGAVLLALTVGNVERERKKGSKPHA